MVQCLFHLPHFNDYFVGEKYKPERNGRNKDIVEIYRSLYLAVTGSAKGEVSSLPLKRSVCTHNPKQPKCVVCLWTGPRRTPTSL